MVVFRERILVKVSVSRAGRRARLESAFILAVYVGHHGRSGALMALTEHGAVNARSFKILPESDRFVASELEKLKGLLWNLNGSLEVERPDRPLLAGPDAQGIPILLVPAGMPPLQPKVQERRMYVTSADVRKYGGSEGCQACTQVYTWGRTNVPIRLQEKDSRQAVRHLSGMPRQCLGSDKSLDQVISSTRKKSRQDMEEVMAQKFQLHMAVGIRISQGWMEACLEERQA